jgi:hypothetical protein
MINIQIIYYFNRFCKSNELFFLILIYNVGTYILILARCTNTFYSTEGPTLGPNIKANFINLTILLYLVF